MWQIYVTFAHVYHFSEYLESSLRNLFFLYELLVFYRKQWISHFLNDCNYNRRPHFQRISIYIVAFCMCLHWYPFLISAVCRDSNVRETKWFQSWWKVEKIACRTDCLVIELAGEFLKLYIFFFCLNEKYYIRSR